MKINKTINQTIKTINMFSHMKTVKFALLDIKKSAIVYVTDMTSKTNNIVR